jgi:hypothetical protein
LPPDPVLREMMSSNRYCPELAKQLQAYYERNGQPWDADN